MQCKKEDAQSVSLRQTRLIHLSGRYPLRVSQRIREFGPTTVSVSQGKGGKKCAPSGRPCVQPVVLEGVKRNESKSCKGRGVYICHDKKEEHPTTDGTDPAKTGDRRPVDTGASILKVYLVVPRP